MPEAFVLINTQTGFEKTVLQNLMEIKGVEQVFSIYGVYDIIAKVNAESMDKLKELLTWRVRRLENVRSTLTLIVM